MIKRNPTAGIILAAGISTRFGRPKQLLRLKDKYLLEWVLDAALSSRLDRIALVLGYASQRILQALDKKTRHSKLQVVLTPQYEQGQSHSLQTGLSAVKDEFPAVMFLLADQPLLNSATINLLLEEFWAADKDICVPACGGRRKNPVLFSRRFYGHLMNISGDIGARNIIDEHPNRVLTVEIDDPLCFLDIDTPQDFEDLNKMLAKATQIPP